MCVSSIFWKRGDKHVVFVCLFVLSIYILYKSLRLCRMAAYTADHIHMFCPLFSSFSWIADPFSFEPLLFESVHLCQLTNYSFFSCIYDQQIHHLRRGRCWYVQLQELITFMQLRELVVSGSCVVIAVCVEQSTVHTYVHTHSGCGYPGCGSRGTIGSK